MTRTALVLRPAPGAARTLARLAALDVPARALPLFAVSPRAWAPPAAGEHDALLLTSANAVRHAGAGLAAVAHLPVVAVGEATAAAARAAGLVVAVTGAGDVAAAVAGAGAFPRLLHLAGADHVAVPGVERRIVYASLPLPVDAAALEAAARGGVALLHSARAAARFAEVLPAGARGDVRLACLSAAVARAAGEGWAALAVAPRPADAALAALAATLAIDP